MIPPHDSGSGKHLQSSSSFRLPTCSCRSRRRTECMRREGGRTMNGKAFLSGCNELQSACNELSRLCNELLARCNELQKGLLAMHAIHSGRLQFISGGYPMLQCNETQGSFDCSIVPETARFRQEIRPGAALDPASPHAETRLHPPIPLRRII